MKLNAMRGGRGHSGRGGGERGGGGGGRGAAPPAQAPGPAGGGRGRQAFLTRAVADEGAVIEHEASDTPAAAPPGAMAWGTTEVVRWLEGQGLGAYAASFRKHHITGSTLPILSRQLLKAELGIESIGHRHLIVEAVKQLGMPMHDIGASPEQLTEHEAKVVKLESLVLKLRKELDGHSQTGAEVANLRSEVRAAATKLAAVQAAVAPLAKEAARPAKASEADAVGAAKLDAKLRQMAASISAEAEEAASAVREELNQKAAALAREVKKVQEAMRDLGKATANGGGEVSAAAKAATAAAAAKGAKATKTASEEMPAAEPKGAKKTASKDEKKTEVSAAAAKANSAALGVTPTPAPAADAAKPKVRPPAPNFFVGVRVGGAAAAKLAALQEAMIAKNSWLGPLRIPPAKLHLTLLLTSVSAADADAAAAALSGLADAAAAALGSLSLKLDGLGHFDGTVLYAKPAKGAAAQALSKFARDVLAPRFTQAGLSAALQEPAHVTLFKAKGGRGGKLKPSLAGDAKVGDLGSSPLGALQLMRVGSTAADGYFEVAASVALGGADATAAPPPKKKAAAKGKAAAKTSSAAAASAGVSLQIVPLSDSSVLLQLGPGGDAPTAAATSPAATGGGGVLARLDSIGGDVVQLTMDYGTGASAAPAAAPPAAAAVGDAAAMSAEEFKKFEADELKAKQAAEAKKAAEKDALEAANLAKAQALEASGKKVAGGMHKFDASEVDVNGGDATADDLMEAFGF
jgi:hypothetical protein